MAEPRVTLTIRLPPGIYEEARDTAETDGISVNELVARAIHHYATRRTQ
jgi:predicted HicB family RNase H-like nuclease